MWTIARFSMKTKKSHVEQGSIELYNYNAYASG